jgi:putative FmdB family regulatory protein
MALSMPVFEYRCHNCNVTFALLVGVVIDGDAERCPQCSSNDIGRVPSRVQRARNEDERLDDLADRVERMGEPESYREMREHIREAGEALDDSAADEMEEMLEAGEELDS